MKSSADLICGAFAVNRYSGRSGVVYKSLAHKEYTTALLFSFEGHALGLAAFGCAAARYLDAVRRAVAFAVIGAFLGAAFYIGAFLGEDARKDLIRRSGKPVTEAVAKGVMAPLSIVSVDPDDGAGAESVLVIDAI